MSTPILILAPSRAGDGHGDVGVKIKKWVGSNPEAWALFGLVGSDVHACRPGKEIPAATPSTNHDSCWERIEQDRYGDYIYRAISSFYSPRHSRQYPI